MRSFKKAPSAPPCDCKLPTPPPISSNNAYKVLYVGGKYDVSIVENTGFKHFTFVNELFDQDLETIATNLMDAFDPHNLFVMVNRYDRCLHLQFQNGCTMDYFFHYTLGNFKKHRSGFLKNIKYCYVGNDFNPFVRGGLCVHDVPNMYWILSRKMMMLDRRHWHDPSIRPEPPTALSDF
jgi:hypothetical protein